MKKAWLLLGVALILLVAGCAMQGSPDQGNGGGGNGGGGNGGGGVLACSPTAGNPGETWKVAFSYAPEAIIFAGGCYVAVEGSSALISPNGLMWHVTQLNANEELSDVAFGRGLLVAVGRGLYTSSDGLNWNRTYLPSAPSWLSGVAYGEESGLFVAVGSEGAIYSSVDGENWERRSSPTTSNLADVAYGGGSFVAVGRNGVIVYSQDGVNWTTAQANGADDRFSVAFGNGRFVTNGRGGLFLSEDGGASWSRANAPVNIFSTVAFGRGTFVIGGGTPGTVVLSPDGENWETIPVPTQATVDFVAYVNGKFLVLTQYGDVLVSTDGRNWETAFNPGQDPIAIRHVNNRFYLLLEGPRITRIASSPDGISWTLHDQSIPGVITALAYGSNRYVAVGRDGALYYSEDAQEWFPGQVAGASSEWDLTDVVYADNRFVAVGLGGLVLVSEDGERWDVKQPYGPTENDFYALAYGAGTLLGASEDGFLWISSDRGDTWTTVDTGAGENLNAIIYTNQRFVAVGDRGTIVASDPSNVETWTLEESGLTGYSVYGDLYSVAYDEQRDVYLAV
ncbi:sialidase family protein [Thermus brockianus]